MKPYRGPAPSNRQVLALGLAALACFAPRAFAADRPNFLFVYTDDQRYDALSVVQKEQGPRGRFPWFQTPNMDRLAAEGVRFRNAFVVNSLCAPSRAVNLTGRYNHLNGVASNFRPFPPGNATHASLLRAAGYTTVYIGKWHMDSQRERPGFDEHYSFIGHARYVDPVFIVNGKDTPRKGWIDDLSTDYAIEFIRKQAAGSKPWSMVVGFKSPHGPFEPPARAAERFAGQSARPTPNLHTPVPYLEKPARAAAPADTENVPVNLNYFRCISAVDDCLGRLLDALDQSGCASNTVVIYTSDNGFYLGEHGLGDKRSAYDESLRVPFLVRYPALGKAAQGRTVDAMVLNLDLAPTLLEFAGLPPAPQMQGRSWRPLLTSTPPNWRQSWFYEYFAEKQLNSRVPDITAVRTLDAKLIRYPGHPGWTELFDLGNDPYETTNLYNQPRFAQLQERMEQEHDRLAREVDYRVPDYTDRPDWWGTTTGSTAHPFPAVRLQFTASDSDGPKLTDRSALANHGRIHNATVGEGPAGRKALHFSGDSWIEVPKSPSLNPAGNAWTIRVVAHTEATNGVLLARGGRSQGYALWIKAGRPAFTVNTANRSVTIQAEDPATGWFTLEGRITADRKLELLVNGQPAASGQVLDFITADPRDAMELGADLGSPVVDPAPPKFQGWIESVTILKPAP